GLSILKASLTSTSALANGLKHYLALTETDMYHRKKPKKESEA
ncbi:hypothetical protein A2U01_0008276, partial [Trifolium medium]|nr:hypothetical protein [Trifolium medium]